MGTVRGFKLIGYDPQVQALMNQYCLAWATQYEISRLRTFSSELHLTLEQYDHIFKELRGNNDKARHAWPLIRALVQASRGAPQNEALQKSLEKVKNERQKLAQGERDPFVELDREEKAIEEGRYAGLGLTSYGPTDSPDWYGGQGKIISLSLGLISLTACCS